MVVTHKRNYSFSPKAATALTYLSVVGRSRAILVQRRVETAPVCGVHLVGEVFKDT